MNIYNGTWRPESHRREALEEGGVWVVYLDTGLTIDDIADPDSEEFRAVARQRFIAMLEDDNFDLTAELDN